MAADTKLARIGALVTCDSYRNANLFADSLQVNKERLAELNPGPVNGGIPLMIGGSGKKVLASR